MLVQADATVPDAAAPAPAGTSRSGRLASAVVGEPAADRARDFGRAARHQKAELGHARIGHPRCRTGYRDRGERLAVLVVDRRREAAQTDGVLAVVVGIAAAPDLGERVP